MSIIVEYSAIHWLHSPYSVMLACTPGLSFSEVALCILKDANSLNFFHAHFSLCHCCKRLSLYSHHVTQIRSTKHYAILVFIHLHAFPSLLCPCSLSTILHAYRRHTCHPHATPLHHSWTYLAHEVYWSKSKATNLLQIPHGQDTATTPSPLTSKFVFLAFSFLYLYTIFDQRHVNISDQVEYGVHDRLNIYPLCRIFYFPWHRHQIELIEGTNGCYCLFGNTLAK